MPTNKARFQTSKPGGASTLGSGSGSKKAHAVASGFPTKASHVQVLYNGKIVTPQSLLPKKTAKTNFMKKKMTAAGPTEEETQEDILQEDTVSEKLPAPLTAASRKTTMGGRRATGGSEELASRGRSLYGNVAKKEVEETITMIISETPTEILLSLPSLIVSTETRDATAVEENNARYAAQIASHKNEDGFTSHPTQTLNNPQKNQNEMAAPNASQDMSCQVHSYDIIDTMTDHSTSTEVDASFVVQDAAAENDGITNLTPYVRQAVTDTVSLALSTPGTTLDVMETTKPPGAMVIGDRKEQGHKSLSRRQQSGVYNMSQPTLDHTVSGEFQQPKDESKPSESGAGTSEDHHLSGHGNTAEDEFPDFVQQDSLQILREKATKVVMESDTILKKLQMVERAVQQNAYYSSILEYRDLPEIKPLSLLLVERAMVVDSVDNLFGGGVGTLGGLGRAGLSPHPNPGLGLGDASIASDTTSNRKASNLGGFDASATSGPSKIVEEDEVEEKPKVKKMFTYAAPSLVQGRTVTAMTWNTENKDVLAVGYGKVEFTVEGLVPTKGTQTNGMNDDERNSGLVLFWSLRNPDYPEKVLRTPFPVTSLDFSSRNPTLLAVGFYSGDIAVYDVRRDEDWDKPIESSVAMSDGHSDPVWQVKWLAKGMDRTENLVSISTDGNVLQWSLKKGLVVSLLMQLKRGGTGEGWISRQAAGLCLDFAPSDPGTYVTGTEEGYIHKCSVSYNEQYLETYTSHDGPVYRIKFSPWWSDLFLSCSADWTVHLYHLHSRNALFSFHSSGEDFSVTDVSWAPRNSTVFAAVTSDAKLQIWDITYSDIDPVVSVDTNLDADDEATTAAPSPTATSNHYDTSLSSRKGTALPHRRDAKPDKDENDRDSSVNKLLKALAAGQNRRMLTSVLFAETSPVVVVGDSTGIVTVYRVNEPIIMRDVSHPADLTERLQDAVWRQADPSEVAKIQNSATQAQNKVVE